MNSLYSMKYSIGFLIPIILIGVVSCGEMVPFWNLTAVKTWDALMLPDEQNAEWNLGLAGFTSAIHKQPTGRLNLSNENAHVTVSYFSVLQLADSSAAYMARNSLVDLRDQSEFANRESASVNLGSGAQMTLLRSLVTPGLFTMDQMSKFVLNDAKFYSLLSKVKLHENSTFKADSRSQVTFIGGSSFELGRDSVMNVGKSFMDLAAEILIGQKCNVEFKGTDFTMVGGSIDMQDKVEFKTGPGAALTIFGSSLTFTEGSKISLEPQSEFNLERNSSLTLARRDLRLKVSEKARLKIEQSTHCLMTDDLTVDKQTSMHLSAAAEKSGTGMSATSVSSSHPSVRCFSNVQQMRDEKDRNFPSGQQKKKKNPITIL